MMDQEVMRQSFLNGDFSPALAALEDPKWQQVALDNNLDLEEVRQGILVYQAQFDTPLGYAAFYELIFDTPMPTHCRGWVEDIYGHYAANKGTVIQAFRGSTKTTTITIGLAAFKIGHYPHKAGLTIQVGDDIATDNAAAVAEIIANNAGWALVFPQVVPDRDKGWGAGGYEVKRTDIQPDEWSQLNAKRKDPSFIGLGYKSRAIIGKHPDNFLFVDDIHDENNTLSQREREKVIKIVTGTIFPTITPETMRVFIGTPWTDDDILAYVEQTGEYITRRTPVVDELGVYAWPDVFTAEVCEKRRLVSGEMEYARMYLLDLEKAKVNGLRFHSFPHERIDPYRWYGGGGCDYASIIDSYQRSTQQVKDRNFFALAYVFKNPAGGLVVYDGVVEKSTQSENETHLRTAQNLFSNWRGTIVEGDGKGEEFITVVQRNPGLRIIPMKTGGKGKKQRLERQMGPWLENGTIRISDADTPFLNHLRKALTDYPNWHLDTLDAIYWGVQHFPEELRIPGEMPTVDELRRKRLRKMEVANPFMTVRSW